MFADSQGAIYIDEDGVFPPICHEGERKAGGQGLAPDGALPRFAATT
jgi:hypothetical protein